MMTVLSYITTPPPILLSHQPFFHLMQGIISLKYFHSKLKVHVGQNILCILGILI